MTRYYLNIEASRTLHILMIYKLAVLHKNSSKKKHFSSTAQYLKTFLSVIPS